jgi:hypothetical protein
MILIHTSSTIEAYSCFIYSDSFSDSDVVFICLLRLGERPRLTFELFGRADLAIKFCTRVIR